MLGSHVPDLRALELLVGVARTGSLSAAAQELGITQQAASSRMRTMEALVGAPLLARTKRGSALTQTGELVVQWAARVLDAAEQLDAGITALRQDQHGHLRVAASLTIAEHLLPGWLVAMRAQQKSHGVVPTEFTMTATNTQRVAGLVTSGAVDLGFVDPSRRVTAATLARTPLVVREAGSGTRTVLERALADLPTAVPVLELSSTAAVRAAVAAGAGPAALSAHAVRDDLASGRLVAIAVTGLDLSRRLHAVWTGGANPPAGPARDLVHWAISQDARVRGGAGTR